MQLVAASVILEGMKKVHVFPDPWGEAVDCSVVGT